MRLLIVVVALLAAACGSSITAPFATEYHVVPPAGPSPCPAGYLALPAIDKPLACRPSPSPD